MQSCTRQSPAVSPCVREGRPRLQGLREEVKKEKEGENRHFEAEQLFKEKGQEPLKPEAVILSLRHPVYVGILNDITF